MLKNIKEILELIVKEASKGKVKLKNFKTKEKSKITSDIVASSELTDCENYRDIVKLKKSYERLMNKFVNPRLNIISPGINIHDKFKYSPRVPNQDKLHSKIVQVVLQRKPNEQPFLPTTVHDTAPSNLLLGWSGQPLNEQSIDPQPELSTKPHDIAAAFFIFPELEGKSNNKIDAKRCCCSIISEINPNSEKHTVNKSLKSAQHIKDNSKLNLKVEGVIEKMQDTDYETVSSHNVDKLETKGEPLQDINVENISNSTNSTILNRNSEIKLIPLDVNESPIRIPEENINMTPNKLIFNPISEPKNKMLSSTTAKTDNTTCEVLKNEKGDEIKTKQKSEHLTTFLCSNLINPTPNQLHSSNICTEEIDNVSIKSKSNILLDGSVCTKLNLPEEQTQGINSSVKIKKDFYSHISNNVNKKDLAKIPIISKHKMDSQNKTLEDSSPIKLHSSGEKLIQDTKPVQNNSHFETLIPKQPSVKDLDSSITSEKKYESENMTRTFLMHTEQCISKNELTKEDKQSKLNTQISPLTVKVDKDVYKNDTKEMETTKKDISRNDCIQKTSFVGGNQVPVLRNKHCNSLMKNKNAYWISESANPKLTRPKTNVIDIITACSSNFLNKDEMSSSSNKYKLMAGKEAGLNNHTLTNDVGSLIKPQLYIGQKNEIKYTNITKSPEKSLEDKIKKSHSNNTHCQIHEKLNDNSHSQTNKPVANDKSNNYIAHHHPNEGSKPKTILIDKEPSNKLSIKSSLRKNSADVNHSESTIVNTKTKTRNIKRTQKYQNGHFKSLKSKRHFSPYLNKLSNKSPSNNCLSRPQYEVDDINSGNLNGNDVGVENSNNQKSGKPMQNKQPTFVIKTRQSLKNGRHKNYLVNGSHLKLSSSKVKKSGKRHLIIGSVVKLDGLVNDGKQENSSHQIDQEHSSPKQISNKKKWTIINNYNIKLIKKSKDFPPEYNAESVLNNNSNFKTYVQEKVLLEKNCKISDLQSPEETYNLKKQSVCNESLPIYEFVDSSNKSSLINENKPDNITKYNNGETSRKLHSKKTDLKIFNLKMYGSVKNKARDSLSDVTVPKSSPVSCKMEHNTKIDKTHSSSSSTGNSGYQTNKQHANEVFSVRVQSRNFSIDHKMNTLLNYIVKRYATTLTSYRQIDTPEHTGNNKSCLEAGDNGNFTIFQKKMVRDGDFKGLKHTNINNQKNKCLISNCNDNNIIDEKKENVNSIIVKNETKVSNNNFLKIPFEKNNNSKKLKIRDSVPTRKNYSFEEIDATKSINKEIHHRNSLKLNTNPQPSTYPYRESKSQTAFVKDSDKIKTKAEPSETDLINEIQSNFNNCSSECEKNKIVKNSLSKWKKSSKYNNNCLYIISKQVQNENHGSTPNNIYNQNRDADIPSCTNKLLKINTSTQNKSPINIISKKNHVTRNEDDKFMKVEQEENNLLLLKEDEPKHGKWKSKTDRLNDWTLQVNKYEFKSHKSTLIKNHSKQRNTAITTPAVINKNTTNVAKNYNINDGKTDNVLRKNCAIGQSDLKINKTNNHCKNVVSKGPYKCSLLDTSTEILENHETNGSAGKKFSPNHENKNKQNVYKSDNHKNQSQNKGKETNDKQNMDGNKEHCRKIECSVTSTKQFQPSQLHKPIVTKNQEIKNVKCIKDLSKINKNLQNLDKNLEKVNNNRNEGNTTLKSSNTLKNTPLIAKFNDIRSYPKTSRTVVDSKRNVENIINSDYNYSNNKNKIAKTMNPDLADFTVQTNSNSTDCKVAKRTLKSKVYPLQSDLKGKEKEVLKPQDTTMKKERLNYDCDSSHIKIVTGLKKSIPLNVTGTKPNKELISKNKFSNVNVTQLHKYDNGFSTRMISDVSDQNNKNVNKALSIKKSSVENIFNGMGSHKETNFKCKDLIKTSNTNNRHQNILLKTKNMVSGNTSNVLSTVKHVSIHGKNKLKDYNYIANFKEHINNSIDNSINGWNTTNHGRFASGTNLAESGKISSILKTNKGQKSDSFKQNINYNTSSIQSSIKNISRQEPDKIQNCVSKTLLTMKKEEKESDKLNSTKAVDIIWKTKSLKDQVTIHPIEKEQQY